MKTRTLFQPKMEKIPTFFNNLFSADYPKNDLLLKLNRLKILIQTKKILNDDLNHVLKVK